MRDSPNLYRIIVHPTLMKLAVAVFLPLFVPAVLAQADRAEAQRNPFSGDPTAIAAGQKLYNQACVACHGTDAKGERAPALANRPYTHGAADGEVFINIRGGIRGTQMPAFKKLTTDEVWQTVSYLRSLSAPAAAPVSRETVPGSPAEGRKLFLGKAACTSCHQAEGLGTAIGPDLALTSQKPAAGILEKILHPTPLVPTRRRRRDPLPFAPTVIAKQNSGEEFRGTLKAQDSFSLQMVDTAGRYHSFAKTELASLKVEPRSLMPGDFSTRLTSAEIQDIVAYVKSLDPQDLTKRGAGDGLTWDRIRNSEREPQNYLTYWGDLGGKHFSTLKQINTENVKQLQAKWSVQLPGDGIVESIPLVVDGIMYTTGPVGGTAQVMALDATTGRQLWRYERKQKVVNPFEINRVNRGVTVFGNRLFFGTLDAALVALDARTGAFLWETQVADSMLGYSITSPPLVVKDKIITGITGGEFGVRAFLDAYDPATGKRLWRWHTIPAKGEFGNDTWAGDSWQHGGAPTWLTGSYDPELNTVYWAIGNPGPDINGDVRQGDNLFSCSVVALDPDTGKRKWHYQFTPNDTHDWDSTEDMVLVDRVWHGQNRKLLLHADRNGVFYVLDRTDGKMLSATPYVRANWVKGWDKDGRPITTPNWRASEEGVTIYPSLGGGSNFQAPSYSPDTGWMYFMFYDGPDRYAIGPAPFEPGKQFQGRGSGAAHDPLPPGAAGIMAFDPEAGKVQWKFPLTENGLAPGVLATGGGLLFAASAEGNFLALNAKTGAPLWHFGAGATIPSSPMSYSVQGKQYVAISTANVLYAFALPE